MGGYLPMVVRAMVTHGLLEVLGVERSDGLNGQAFLLEVFALLVLLHRIVPLFKAPLPFPCDPIS